jgi:hypothetical protein
LRNIFFIYLWKYHTHWYHFINLHLSILINLFFLCICRLSYIRVRHTFILFSFVSLVRLFKKLYTTLYLRLQSPCKENKPIFMDKWLNFMQLKILHITVNHTHVKIIGVWKVKAIYLLVDITLSNIYDLEILLIV